MRKLVLHPIELIRKVTSGIAVRELADAPATAIPIKIPLSLTNQLAKSTKGTTPPNKAPPTEKAQYHTVN